MWRSVGSQLGLCGGSFYDVRRLTSHGPGLESTCHYRKLDIPAYGFTVVQDRLFQFGLIDRVWRTGCIPTCTCFSEGIYLGLYIILVRSCCSIAIHAMLKYCKDCGPHAIEVFVALPLCSGNSSKNAQDSAHFTENIRACCEPKLLKQKLPCVPDV